MSNEFPRGVHRRLLLASTHPDGAAEWDRLFQKHRVHEILDAWGDLVEHGLLDSTTLTATEDGRATLSEWTKAWNDIARRLCEGPADVEAVA